MKVSSVNQDSIIDVEVSGFLNMKVALFIVDSFEDIVDVVVHSSHSVKPFFCSSRAEFVVIIKVYGAWIKAIETSVWEEFISSGGCGIISKFCVRWPCSPAVLPIMTLDV